MLREQNEIIIKQNQMIVQEIVKRKIAEEEQLSEKLLKPLTGFPMCTAEEFTELNEEKNVKNRELVGSIYFSYILQQKYI